MCITSRPVRLTRWLNDPDGLVATDQEERPGKDDTRARICQFLRPPQLPRCRRSTMWQTRRLLVSNVISCSNFTFVFAPPNIS